MTFQELKVLAIQATQLDKDALHIYIGMGVYLSGFLLAKTLFKDYGIRQLLALLITTAAALTGEYFDLNGNLNAISDAKLAASIHDLINTCALPYLFSILTTWTSIFKRKSDF